MPDWSPVDLLPGLYTALCAILLWAALRRWYDPIPGTVLAAFGIVLGILFGGVLFGGGILLPLDNLRGQAPFRGLPPAEPHGNILQGDLIQLVTPSLAAGREALAAGRWPLWQARVGAGMPLLADPQSQVLQPLVLAALPLPLDRAAGVIAALRVFLALTFTFVLFRRLGLGGGAALAGAFAFGLGGFVLLWVGWPIANSAALLPLFLYGIVRCGQEGGRRDLLLLAVGTFSLLLAGHPETILYSLALGAAFLLAQTLDRNGDVPKTVRLRRLRNAVLALALGTALAAPALLTALDYLPETLRAERMREPQAATGEGFGAELARRWLPIVAPNAYGNSRFVDYWGLSNTNEDAAGFAGTAILLAVLLAVLAGLPARRRFPRERLALAVTAFCLVWLAHPPGLFESRRLLLPLGFCLAYLGACSLERVSRGESRRWPVLAAAAGLAALLAWAYLAHPHPEDPERLAILRFGWLRWQMRFLVLAALLMTLARGRKSRRWMPGAVAALVAAELILAHRPANPPMPKRLAFPVTAPVKFLQENLDKAPGLERIAALGRAFPPNLPALYGLSDARVYNPAAPAAYLSYMAPVTAAWWGELPELGRPEDPLHRSLGIRYLLTEPEQRLPAPFQLALADPAAWLWEQPDPLPLLFYAPGTGKARPDLGPVESQRIGAWTHLRRDRLLASRLYQDGGWLLLIDGHRHPTVRTGNPFVAAQIPAGEHRLMLLYRPRGFLWGLGIAAFALAAAAAAWVPVPSGLQWRREHDAQADRPLP